MAAKKIQTAIGTVAGAARFGREPAEASVIPGMPREDELRATLSYYDRAKNALGRAGDAAGELFGNAPQIARDAAPYAVAPLAMTLRDAVAPDEIGDATRPENFRGGPSNLALARQEDARQVAELAASRRPQGRPAPLQAAPNDPAARWLNPADVMAARNPKFKAALAELIAAHGGRMR